MTGFSICYFRSVWNLRLISRCLFRALSLQVSCQLLTNSCRGPYKPCILQSPTRGLKFCVLRARKLVKFRRPSRNIPFCMLQRFPPFLSRSHIAPRQKAAIARSFRNEVKRTLCRAVTSRRGMVYALSPAFGFRLRFSCKQVTHDNKTSYPVLSVRSRCASQRRCNSTWRVSFWPYNDDQSTVAQFTFTCGRDWDWYLGKL